MKKLNNKKVAFIIILTLLSVVFTLCVSASAANSPVGSVGTGYINVQSTTSISAWTTANSSGTIPSDYVSVDFWAYTYGSTVWRPYPSEGEVKNIGANYIEAFASNTDTENIEYADSYHKIQRAGYLSSSWNTDILPS